jgi:pilus assembly protein Flp/PilA
MKNLIKKVKGFLGNEEGQGLVEYALILTLIAIVIIVALKVVGRSASNAYVNAAANLN